MASFAADAKSAQAKPVETYPDMDAEDEDPSGILGPSASSTPGANWRSLVRFDLSTIPAP